MAADASECNIKVVCRVRPQSGGEVQQGGLMIVKFPANDTIIHSVSCPICVLDAAHLITLEYTSDRCNNIWNYTLF